MSKSSHFCWSKSLDLTRWRRHRLLKVRLASTLTLGMGFRFRLRTCARGLCQDGPEYGPKRAKVCIKINELNDSLGRCRVGWAGGCVEIYFCPYLSHWRHCEPAPVWAHSREDPRLELVGSGSRKGLTYMRTQLMVGIMQKLELHNLKMALAYLLNKRLVSLENSNLNNWWFF